MRVVVMVVKGLTAIIERTALLISRLQVLLYGILPALLPPEELSGLIRGYYDTSYRNVADRHPEEAYKWTLEPWEERVLARHMTNKGTVLALGAGIGRESIALAEHGFRVVGLDINREGLLLATHRAARQGVRSSFLQGDFLAVPIRPKSVDYVLLSGVMFSSIPGRTRRQNCLQHLRLLLKPGGKAILNFLIAREEETRTQRLIHRLNAWLLRLPWSNQEYQPGDTCTNSHFMHVFAHERELRDELSESGATTVEVVWQEGFAVVA